MRVFSNFALREIAGECILLPAGAAAARFKGLIRLNETARSAVENFPRQLWGAGTLAEDQP